LWQRPARCSRGREKKNGKEKKNGEKKKGSKEKWGLIFTFDIGVV
jgi:hypothetical protein